MPLLATAVAVTAAAVAAPAFAGDYVTDPVHDFDCDGQRDAVHPTPNSTVGDHAGAGSIIVQISGDDEIVELSQATAGIAGAPEFEDGFGSQYTSYDENGDGCDDLVVGAYEENVSGENGEAGLNAGMVWVIPGSADGLVPQDSWSINLNTPGVPGSVADWQDFGRSLAAGTASDGQSFLVIGAPGDQGGSIYHVADGDVVRTNQDSSGVSGSKEGGDRFGEYLSVTDRFIAVSAHREDIADADAAGMVHVFSHQRADGHLKQVSSFHQDSPGVTGHAEDGDAFGEEGLTVLNFRAADDAPVSALLAVGSPNETVTGGEGWNGMAHLFRSTSMDDREQLASVHQSTSGVEGTAEPFDLFGSAVVLSTQNASGTGTPSTTHWAVQSQERFDQTGPNDGNEHPQVHVFDVAGEPGDNDQTLNGDNVAVPLSQETKLESLSASDAYLYLETPGDRPGTDEQAYPDTVYGVPWSNILDGQDDPVVTFRVTPWP